jgi:hypothetical protein
MSWGDDASGNTVDIVVGIILGSELEHVRVLHYGIVEKSL